MSETRVTDISTIIPSVISPLAQTKLTQYVNFLLHGLADMPNLPPGIVVNFPGFKNLSADSTPMADGQTYTTQKIDVLKDIALVLHRKINFGANDLSEVLSGQDIMGEIAMQLGNYWAKQMQKAMFSTIKGVFASTGPLATTNSHSVYVDTSSPVVMTPAIAATGLAKLGDELNNVAAWVMHSKVYADLLAAGYISTSTIATPYGLSASGELQSFMGKPVIMADTTHATAGTTATAYNTYGIGKGALSFGIQKALRVEPYRDAINAVDVIASQIHFAAHVRGVAWTGTANSGAANSDLETAANWTLAAESEKMVGICRIITN